MMRRLAVVAVGAPLASAAIAGAGTAYAGNGSKLSGSTSAPSQMILTFSRASITTSTGVRVALTANATHFDPYLWFPSQTYVYLNLERRVAEFPALRSEFGDVGERHSWEATIAQSAFTLGSNRTAHVVSNLAGLGSVDWTFHPNGAATTTDCGSGNSETVQPGTITGTLLLHTRSTGKHAWGDVGSRTKPFDFGSNARLSTYQGNYLSCEDPGASPCLRSMQWRAGQLTGGWIADADGKTQGFVVGERFVNLNKRATRTDVTVARAPVPTMTPTNGNWVVSAKGNARNVTGAITLNSSGSAVQNSGTCGKNSTQTRDAYTATIDPSATMRVHEDIFGDFEPAQDSGTAIDLYNWS